jgi:hypothetical protein
MSYSRSFFALQLSFAEQLSARLGVPVEAALHEYTIIGKPFDPAERGYEQFAADFNRASDRAAHLHARYLQSAPPDTQLGDSSFMGHKLFGPFYYMVKERGIIRPHVARLQPTL